MQRFPLHVISIPYYVRALCREKTGKVVGYRWKVSFLLTAAKTYPVVGKGLEWPFAGLVKIYPKNPSESDSYQQTPNVYLQFLRGYLAHN